jgi:PAS domain S-box-containing protein
MVSQNDELVKVSDVLSLFEHFKNNDSRNLSNQFPEAFKPIIQEMNSFSDKHFVDFNQAPQNGISDTRLLKVLLKSSTSLLSYIDNNYEYSYVNQAYEDWFGLKAQDLIGKKVIDIVGELAYLQVKPLFLRAFAGEAITLKKEMHYRFGGIKNVEIHYIPDFDLNGSVQGVFAVVHDLTQTHRAEQNAFQLENDIGLILNNMPAMIGQWSNDQINIHANKVYSDYFDRTPESIKGLHIRELVGEELYKLNLPYILKVLSGEPQYFEREIPTPSGKIKKTLASYIPNFVKGQVEGFFVIVSDVTELKSKNKIIADQKIFYSDILNSMLEGFAVQDKDGKILYFNDAASKILGLSHDQLLGKTSLDPGWEAIRTDGSPFPGEEHPAMQTIKTGLPQFEIDMGIRTPDGETKWLKINSVPFSGVYENQQASVLVTFRDVTSQFHNDKLMSGLIINSPGMIYQFKLSTDGVMSFPFVSPKAFDIFEISNEEFEADSGLLIKMAHESDRPGLIKAIQESAETLLPFYWKGRMITKDKKLKWVSAKSIPRKEHDGTILWDGILTDITYEVNLEEEISIGRMTAAHTAKLAALGEMSAGVAHEINNPLAIISGMTKVLSYSLNDPEKFAHKVTEINKSVQRISKIVNGLKRFARVELKTKRQNYQLKLIIQELHTYMELKSKQDFVELKIEINSDSSVFCDALEIEQVIINLINNAFDAVKEFNEKWVQLKLYDNTNDVIIRIIDSGKGISLEDGAKLFDPFFTKKKVGEGTGLGLSISKGIIKDHNGEIQLIHNHPNTCFEIRIPKSK